MTLAGCRCQAMAVTGDAAATDPACHFIREITDDFAAICRDRGARAGRRFVPDRRRRLAPRMLGRDGSDSARIKMKRVG